MKTKLLEGKKSCVYQDPGKETLTPQETEPDLPASVRGFPVEVQVSRGSP